MSQQSVVQLLVITATLAVVMLSAFTEYSLLSSLLLLISLGMGAGTLVVVAIVCVAAARARRQDEPLKHDITCQGFVRRDEDQ